MPIGTLIVIAGNASVTENTINRPPKASAGVSFARGAVLGNTRRKSDEFHSHPSSGEGVKGEV